MIHTSCLIDSRAVTIDGLYTTKRELFADLAARAHACYGIDEARIRDALEEREALGSTGFGGGVAIPHAKIDGIASPVGLCFRLARPLGYDAMDDQPVDLVFCLLSPAHSGAVHLRALADVSRALRDEVVLAKLRGATTEAAFFALLESHAERDAA